MSEKTRRIRCAVYTRKSHEEGLEQEFNSLDAQREAGESYVLAQRPADVVGNIYFACNARGGELDAGAGLLR